MIRKYINFINESKEDWDNVVQNCKDILMELQDDNFTTNVVRYEMTYYPDLITVSIKKSTYYKYSDIENVVERLKLYLSDYGMEIEWCNPSERLRNRPDIKHLNLTLDSGKSSDLYHCKIEFRENNFVSPMDSPISDLFNFD